MSINVVLLMQLSCLKFYLFDICLYFIKSFHIKKHIHSRTSHTFTQSHPLTHIHMYFLCTIQMSLNYRYHSQLVSKQPIKVTPTLGSHIFPHGVLIYQLTVVLLHLNYIFLYLYKLLSQ